MIQLKPNLLLAEKKEYLYVLDADSGRVHTFNPTAKVIFQLCMEPIAFDELVQEYLGYFPIEASEAQADVRMILALFEQYDLLQSGSPSVNA